MTWAVGALDGGQSREVQLVVRPASKGTLELTATAETSDGLRAEQRAGLPVDTAGLKLAVTAPPQIGTGDKVPVSIAVTNTGAVPLDGVTAAATAKPDLLILRFLAADARPLRAALDRFLTAFRAAPLPRVWSS